MREEPIIITTPTFESFMVVAKYYNIFKDFNERKYVRGGCESGEPLCIAVGDSISISGGHGYSRESYYRHNYPHMRITSYYEWSGEANTRKGRSILEFKFIK